MTRSTWLVCYAPALIFGRFWGDRLPRDAKRKMLAFGDLPCDHSGEETERCISPRVCPFSRLPDPLTEHKEYG